MNPVFAHLAQLRSLPRKALETRTMAYLLRELPAWDATPLFCNRNELSGSLGNHDYRYRVHMTAVDGLLGRTHYQELHKFMKRNPDYKFYLWSNDAQDGFMQAFFQSEPIYRVYQEVQWGIVRADIVRLCLLWVYGGFYFDCKSQLKGALDQFSFENKTGYLIHETHKIQDEDILTCLKLPIAYQLTNWFMAFPPGHDFLQAAIDEIVDQWRAGYQFPDVDFNVAVWKFSGPRMITRIANRMWLENPQIQIVSCYSNSVAPIYACRGSWVRKVIRPHYSQKVYKNS